MNKQRSIFSIHSNQSFSTLLWISVFTAILISVILITTHSASAALTRIAYWHLDETGGTIIDAEGTQNGVCTNCPVPISGVINGARDFNGVNQAINIPANSAFNWTSSSTFSIELWVQAYDVNSSCNGEEEVFIGRGSAGNGQWFLGCTGDGTMQFSLSDNNGKSLVLTGQKPITDYTWHHVAATYDGSSGVATLYVDATEVVSDSETFSGNFAPPSADLHIGYLNNAAYLDGYLDEIAIYNGLLSTTEINSHYFLARDYSAMCAGGISVMPLGDSITMGIGPDVDDSMLVSYRRDLWHLLKDNGHQIDFVGSFVSGEHYTALEGFDPDHEGDPGKTANYVANNVIAFLNENPADVILLHIGTNGLTSNVGNVDLILDRIDEYDENITVVLARIINQVPWNNTVTDFNSNMEEMVNLRLDEGDKIILVDMENGAGINYSLHPTGDMADGLHPHDSGYAKMATVWYNALAGFLPNCPSAPNFVSTPVTTAVTNQPYSYTVVASGYPKPTLQLTQSPAGMTLDSGTGLIEWTPTAAGSYNVNVRATNSEGTANQPFTIIVSDPVPPSITSSAVTTGRVGQFYSYNVEATGIPAPTFSLSTAPPTMTIDPETGVISWVPVNTGSFPVTVAATNSQASDTQSFNIVVSEAPACPADIAAYWPLDTSFNNTYLDVAGSADATCDGNACPTLATGAVNNSVKLDGTNDGLDAPHNSLFNWQATDSFSIELWVNTTDNCAIPGVFISKYLSTTQDKSTWWLGCTEDEGGEGIATLNLRDANGNDYWLDGQSKINDGQWHHIVAVRDGNANINRLFVDGVEETSETNVVLTGDLANSSPINIGYMNNEYYYGGLLDEIAIYNRALFAAEIQQHYTNGLSGSGYCSDTSAPVITSPAVTSAITNQPYSYDVEATGTPAPTFSLLTGAPAGMTIDENTGLIQWTPPNSGSFPVTVRAANEHGADQQAFTIVVANEGAPTITSSPVEESYVGQYYTYLVEATGVPAPTFALVTAPAGMTIDTNGLIEWVPAAIGNYDVQVKAENSQGEAIQDFTIEVFPAPYCPADMTAYWPLDTDFNNTYIDVVGDADGTCVGNACPTLTTGVAGKAATFDGVNDRLTIPHDAIFDWSTAASSFAIELWVNTTDNCATPAVFIGKYSNEQENRSTWWLGCSEDEGGDGIASFSLRDANGNDYWLDGQSIINDGQWHHIVAVRDGSANVNRLFVNGVEEATEVTEDYNAGFANNSAIEIASMNNLYYFEGALDEIALYNRALTGAEIANHYQKGLANEGYCSLAQKPQITSTAVTTALVGQAYNYTVTADGVPAPTFSLGSGAPAGMSINSTTGKITWTPTSGQIGPRNVTVIATNENGADQQSFTITVNMKPVITSTPPNSAVVGNPYTYDVNANGFPAPTYQLVTKPSGMNIDASSGLITWTPTSTASANVLVRVFNAYGEATQSFTISVNSTASAPTITSQPTLMTAVNKTYTYAVKANGAPSPTFSLDKAPAGMSINSQTGVITWTPTQPGTYAVTVRASNMAGSVTQSFNVSVRYTIFLPLTTKP